MQPIKRLSCGNFGRFLFIRFYRSAYRLKPGALKSDELDVNKTDEQRYQEKVTDAMLHKQRSPLRVFERKKYQERHKHIELPNAPYYDRDDLPIYGSFKNYVKEAERARRKLREKKVFWKSMDVWMKRQKRQPKMVNIGLPLPTFKRDKAEVKARKQELRRLQTDPEMEKAARNRTLKVDIEEFFEERKALPAGIIEVFNIAMHYKIYRDLFYYASFYPVVPITVAYADKNNDQYENPVYYGNELTPSEASNVPDVRYESEEGQLWSLLMTSPDENLENSKTEYLHWFVGNIKGNDVTSGETLVDYLQPIPPRGTGYHRMVFLLFKQNKEIDFSDEKRLQPCLSLRERNFITRIFYEKYKKDLTPVSLRFFQTRWEESVMDVFHHNLDMHEPVYEFEPWKVDRLARLKTFPHKKTTEWLMKFMPKEPIYPGGGKFS